jgi:uncharacterized protein (TIGR03435 family)
MTNRVESKGSFGRRLLIAAVAVTLVGQMPQIRAQSQTGAPTFEVASIKPTRADSTTISSSAAGDRFTAANHTPIMLIALAYHLKTDGVSGGPGWAGSERYDVEAKGKGVGEPAQLRAMLQALLADRFKLSVHRGTKEVPVYALVVGKNGAKLHEADAASTDGSSGIRASILGHLTGKKASMADLAASLTSIFGRPVLDQTGIKGLFDLQLNWTPDDSQPKLPEGAPPPETSGPSIFTAVQEQLGLKLESTKGNTDVIVIDSIEKPSGN